MNQNANSLGIFTESISLVSCPNCDAELDVSEFQVFEEIVCPSCQEKFQVPGRLGDFILIEELGRGAMGCVYLAMDESLKRLVALKVIRKEYGEDPKMLETVQREAQAMATLNHRNIVQVYSFGRVKEQPYFVMELLEGERLDEMMAGGNQIPEIRALEIALDVAHGLDAANAAGLTHGDIKPANILMNDNGVAKVVDFGLAKFMEPGAEIEVWGTPYYIAPEKARKKGEDSRSDQYSLGGTLFHALAGQPPFDGPNPTKVVVAALKEETPNLLDFNPNVSEKTAAVIRRMMDKNPNRRYPTYASLLSDLNLALKEAKALEELRIQAEKRLQEKQNRKMNPLIPIAMGVMLIMTVGIVFVVWQQTRKPSEPPARKYEGPARELHQPFTRPEVRNFSEAVDALKEKNLTLAKQELVTAERLIPDKHAARAWFKFMEAGIYFYAQYPEQARALLEEAGAGEELIFDAEKTPGEDPRTLARYALGTLDEKDLSRALRGTQPYYAHLAELARGYRLLLAQDANSSARFFRSYSEQRMQGVEWPYLLQPLAPLMHLPLEKLISDAEKRDQLQAQAAELLSGLGLRTVEGYPLFRSTFVNAKREAQLKNSSAAKWEQRLGLAMAEVPGNHILVNATGLQILPQRSFSLCARIQSPTPDQRVPGQSDVLFHFGTFQKEGGETPGADTPALGVIVEFPPVMTGSPSVRIRIGDGKQNLLVQSLPSDAIRVGTQQIYSLTWDGYREDGSEPSFQLSLYVDATLVGMVDLKNGPFPDLPLATNVAVGRGFDRGILVGWDGRQLPVDRIIVIQKALDLSTLKNVIIEIF
ncbi:MAG: serine/threonine protein kinase [Kiritimatiellia bacterium]